MSSIFEDILLNEDHGYTDDEKKLRDQGITLARKVYGDDYTPEKEYKDRKKFALHTARLRVAQKAVDASSKTSNPDEKKKIAAGALKKIDRLTKSAAHESAIMDIEFK